MDTVGDGPGIAEIVADVAYPAEKWQITTCAEIYGADVPTLRTLYSLPPRRYDSPADVLSAME